MWAPNSLAHLWSSFSNVASTCTYQKYPSAEKGGKTQSCLCMCSLGTQSTSDHAHHSIRILLPGWSFWPFQPPCGMGRRIRRRSWTCKILCAPRLIVTNRSPNDLQLLSFLMQTETAKINVENPSKSFPSEGFAVFSAQTLLSITALTRSSLSTHNFDIS